MKNLSLYIKESLLDDEDVLMKDTGDEAIKNEILKFLKDNYSGIYKISKTPINGKYWVDSSTNLIVKNKNITSLTNEYFEFGRINRDFDCSSCEYLTSLEGAPKEVSRFYGHHCNSLTSLKGAPEKVRGDFYCSYCDSLTTLEGAPEKVGGDFNCRYCKSLISLEGAPKEVGLDFNCDGCESLTTLKGAPEKVGGDFNCDDCKTQFTIDDVRKVSKVKGEINSW